MNLKYIVVDDEEPARSELIWMINKYTSLVFAGEAADGKQALDIINERRPDIVFLDIQMPGLSGIETAKRIVSLGEDRPEIIFVTAYNEYALNAFEVEALDYLLKPVDEKRLVKAVARLESSYHNRIENSGLDRTGDILRLLGKLSNQNQENYITVSQDEVLIPISSSTIRCLHTKGKNTIVNTTSGCYTCKNSLSYFKEKLTGSFVQVHRAYIINLDFVSKIEPWFNGSYVLTIEGESETIPLSRNYAKAFKQRINME